MEILNYSLVAIVISIGLFLGIWLAKIAREELKPGAKYLEVFSDLVLAGVFVVLAFHYQFDWVVIALLSAGYLALLFLNQIKKIYFFYFVFGIFYFITLDSKYFLILASLLFVYGLPMGSLEFYRKHPKREYMKNIALSIAAFLLSSHVLYLLG